MKSFAKNHTCKDASTPDDSGRVHTHSIGCLASATHAMPLTDFRLKTTGLDGGKLNPFDLASEPIFPPYLMTHPPSDLRVKGDVMEFFRPTTLKGT